MGASVGRQKALLPRSPIARGKHRSIQRSHGRTGSTVLFQSHSSGARLAQCFSQMTVKNSTCSGERIGRPDLLSIRLLACPMIFFLYLCFNVRGRCYPPAHHIKVPSLGRAGNTRLTWYLEVLVGILFDVTSRHVTRQQISDNNWPVFKSIMR